MGPPSKVGSLSLQLLSCQLVQDTADQFSVFVLQLAGDPRREELVKPYEPSLPTEPTGDIIMMIGLGCAAFGLLTKVLRSHALQGPVFSRLRIHAE